MKIFDLKVWNRLYYDGGHIVAELQPTLTGHRRWIAIYKVPTNHPLAVLKQSESKYSILDFELKNDLIETYFGEEDKQNQKRFYINSEDELLTLLENLHISPSLFTYPWKCDYPL